MYPFGVAVYRGVVTEANLSMATPLQIFPVVACPMLIRLVTGYAFQPDSDLAVVLPGKTPAIPMEAQVTAAGAYGGPSSASQAPVPFSPGMYTVVAGDEWGALAFLHFQVAGITP